MITTRFERSPCGLHEAAMMTIFFSPVSLVLPQKFGDPVHGLITTAGVLSSGLLYIVD